MKILLVCSQFEVGGAARVAAVMCKGFFEKGVDLRVVTDVYFSKQVYGLNKNITFIPLYEKNPGSGKLSKLLRFKEAVINTRKAIKDFKPDVIIAIEAYMYIRVLCARFNLHYPIIVADHRSFANKKNRFIYYTRMHLYKYADGISILTEKDRKLLGDKYPQKKVIYNPLPFPLLETASERRNNILCAGRLDVWYTKGFDIILDIWSALADSYPDWMLEIAGTGSQSSLDILNKKVSSNKLENRVRFLGQIQDMRALYQETSIFVLPSRMEGFPMVLMEAMSQGCASVAFSIDGAISEMVTEGAAFVVNDGDVESFTNKLDFLLNNDDERKEMSLKAIASVKRFSQESFVNHWMEYVETIVLNYRTIRK